jgi:hypothetical protein
MNGRVGGDGNCGGREGQTDGQGARGARVALRTEPVKHCEH